MSRLAFVTRSIVPTEGALADRCGKGRPLILANGRFWHFGDIDAVRFNVRFRALFGHQSMARLCRRMTQSRHRTTLHLCRPLALSGMTA